MKTALPNIAYPVLLWRSGYVYVARTALELCVHPRLLFDETVNLSKAGVLRLADSNGRQFKVVDWERVQTFGSLEGMILRLMGSVFAVPILTDEKQLSVEAFKRILIQAVRSRYRYDTDKTTFETTIDLLQRADSYSAAMATLPKL